MFGFDDLIGGAVSALGAADQRRFEAGQAQKQMDFQERMSSTAYQRATADMKAAGLNPMLAFQQGGASAPVGAMASGGENIGGAGVSSALEMARTKAQLALMTQQAGKTYWEGQAAQQSAGESPDQYAPGAAGGGRTASPSFNQAQQMADIRMKNAQAASASALADLNRIQRPRYRWESSTPGLFLGAVGKFANSAAALTPMMVP